jgi:hypothetical protein
LGVGGNIAILPSKYIKRNDKQPSSNDENRILLAEHIGNWGGGLLLLVWGN